MFDMVYAYHIEFPEDNIFFALNPTNITYKYVFAFMREDCDEPVKEHVHQFACLSERDPQYFALCGDRHNGTTTYTWKWTHEREKTDHFDNFAIDWINILREKYENPDCREKIDNILEQYNKTKQKTIAELNMYVHDAIMCCANI
jgi:hypothetical protein